MKRKLILCGCLALGSTAVPVFAGYTAVTNPTTVDTPSSGGPAVGDAFDTPTPGSFLSFIGDTPADPTITGGDLSRYLYTLNGSINSIDTLAGVINYTGSYDIFYDLAGSGMFNASDPTVSAGNFDIDATFIPATNNAALTGTLTQTTGPSNPAFDDLSYGGNPVDVTGTYVGNDPGVSGIIDATLRQNAVPEPTSMAFLGLGALALLRKRRSNSMV
jgi:hypothetical protein